MMLSKIDTSQGVLSIVHGCSGDVLNFGITSEQAKAVGIDARMIVVADDVATPRSRLGKNTRRGLCGLLPVIKIAGALAAKGASLDDVYNVAKLAAENIVTVGAGLDGIVVPGSKAQPAVLQGFETGVGNGCEPGCSNPLITDFFALIEYLLKQLLDLEDKDRAFLNVNSNEVVLMINSYGELSPMELGAITTEIVHQLKRDYNIKPVRVYTGVFLAQLDRHGFAICILNVVNTNIGGPSMVELLDAPSEGVGWVAPIRKETWEAWAQTSQDVATTAEDVQEETPPSGLKMKPTCFESAIKHGLNNVIAAEPDLTKFDGRRC